MAIQLIGYVTVDGSGTLALNGTWTGGIGGPLQENDIVLCCSVADSQQQNTPTGFTSLWLDTSGLPDSQLSWKRMGSTPDTSITGLEPNDGSRHVAVAYRGVDTTNTFDVAVGSVTSGASGLPNPPSKTSVTAGARSFIVGFLDDDDALEATAPTGWTSITNQRQSGSIATILLAERDLATAGAYDPGAWSSSDTDEWFAFHVVLRPAASTDTSTLAADGASYSLTGTAAALKVSRKIAANGATYTLTGAAATLARGRRITAAGATYTLTGAAATLKVARKIAANGATYTLTGTAAGLRRRFTVVASGASYTLTGTAAALRTSRKLAANGASYTLTGANATLTYTSIASPDYTLDATGASYALTGTAARLAAGRKIAALGATYTLTGAAAVLAYRRVLTAEGASFALTGQDARLRYLTDYRLSAEGASYVLSLGSATFTIATFWNAVPATSETWTPEGATAETWSAVPSTSETWFAQNATSETWTPVPSTSETWN